MSIGGFYLVLILGLTVIAIQRGELLYALIGIATGLLYALTEYIRRR